MIPPNSADSSGSERLSSWLLLLGLLACVGCQVFVPTPQTPMGAIHQRRADPGAATGVLILLPGAGDRADDLVDHGLFELVAELAPNFDVIAADAHLGYYYANSFLARLQGDVIAPARAAGYRQVWLLGVSMGGMGAAVYAGQHPEQIDGVLLLAPYLGDGEPVVRPVFAAPSLAEWDPDGVRPTGEFGRKLQGAWRWLQRQAGPDGDSVVFLAFGTEDGPGTVDDRLRQALPPERTLVSPGGHKWWVWLPMIRELLPRMSAAAAARGSVDGSVGGQ